MPHSIKRIRTSALFGQSGSGKTSLAEALLAKAGAIPATGSVERGKQLAERLPREKALAGQVLLIARAKFDDVLRKRVELLEKKEPATK